MREDYKNDWAEASLVKDLNYLKTGVEDYSGKKDYYSTGSIKNDSVTSEGLYTHVDRPSRANRVGQVGDILQARMKNTDKAVLITNNLNDQLFSTGFFQIRADSTTILPKYLFHYFKSYLFLNQKDSNCSGSTQSALNDKSAQKLLVPIAPIPIQRTIIAKIEEFFSDLDKGIADLKKAQDQLMIFRQAVLKKAFEGELTKTALKSIQITEIGEILTGNTPTKKDPNNYNSADYNFYKPTDLNAGNNVIKSNDFLSKQGYENSRQVPAFSILVTCIGATIGKTGLIKSEGGFNQQINAIVPFENYIPEFIFYQVISIDFQTQIKTNASSTTLPILNKGKFSKLKMNVCSKDEQHKIVQEIESRLSVSDNVELSILESLEKAKALRQSILKKAFEGTLLSEEEIAACKAAPDYEPASVLLEKIKAEKKK